MARSLLPAASTPIAPPRKTYSFTEYTRMAPLSPIPGDRLDTELHELRASLTAAVDVINGLLDGRIPLPTQDVTLNIPGIMGTKIVDIATGHVTGGQRRLPVLQPIADVTPRAYELLNHSGAAADRAENFADIAKRQREDVDAFHLATSQAAERAENAAGMIEAGVKAVHTNLLKSEAIAEQLTNDGNHAALATFDAIQAEQLAWKWAEYLSGPVMTEAEYAALDPALIPPGYTYNPVTGMGTAGLWSSKWWAVRAQQLGDQAQDAADAAAGSAGDAADSAADAAAAADDFEDLYLGSHPTAPGLDNDGDPLQQGAMYWNSTTNQLSVWSGTGWIAVTTPTGVIPASGVTYTPTGTVSATNVQAAITELDAEKIPDAPADGGSYGRRNHAWVSVVTPTVDWGDIINKPGSFPPSAHTHPISQVTGLQAALDSEQAARITGDSGLQTQVDTNSAAISAEATARSAADNALDATKVDLAGDTMTGPLNVVTPPTAGANATSKTYVDAGLATKIGDAPNDGAQYARQNAAWTPVVGGASVGDVPPSPALDNQLWWESDTGRMFIRYFDGNSRAWVQVNYTLDANAFLSVKGGTITDNLIIKPAPGSSPGLKLDKPASGTSSYVQGLMNGKSRWLVAVGNTTAETGSNAGSDFGVWRYDDAGAFLDAPLTISRATAQVTINGNAVVNPEVTTGHAIAKLNKLSSGTVSQLTGQNAGLPRWAMQLGDATAEAGSNAGSNFGINRYNDAGTYIDTTLQIARSNGAINANAPSLSLNSPASSIFLVNKAAVTGQSEVRGTRAAVARWGLVLGDSNPETGSQTGSHFAIQRYNYAGTFIDQPLYILRTTAQMVVSGDSPAKPTAGQWVASSDKRIKRSIRSYAKGLAEILRLRPVSFKFRPETGRDPDKRHVGMIAQDVREVMPEMIFDMPFKEKDVDLPDALGFDPTNIQYALIRAVQELHARIEALEAAP